MCLFDSHIYIFCELSFFHAQFGLFTFIYLVLSALYILGPQPLPNM